MRKISTDIEGPIDNFIIDIVDHFSEYYKDLNYTPNVLTTYSLFFGILSSMLFYFNYNLLAASTFMIAYYFDCADGFYARKYDMVTKFGDMYDHVADVCKIMLIYIIMYIKNEQKFIMIFPIIFILTLSSLAHLGCQEMIYDKKESRSLDTLNNLCAGDPYRIMKYTRYISCGTMITTVALLIATF